MNTRLRAPFPWITILGALLCATTAQAHVFTTLDGKLMDAQIVGATADQATLKTENGTQTTLPLNKLISQDRNFVAAWLKAHVPAETHVSDSPPVRYNFEVSWTKEKGATKVDGAKHTKITRTNYVVHIKVINKSAFSADDVKLHYQLHYNDVHGTETTLRHKDGVIKLPALAPGGSVTVDTDSLELDSTQLSAGYHYTSGAPTRQIDYFKGIAATFVHDGKPVFEFVAQGITKAPEVAAKKSSSTTSASGGKIKK